MKLEFTKLHELQHALFSVGIKIEKHLAIKSSDIKIYRECYQNVNKATKLHDVQDSILNLYVILKENEFRSDIEDCDREDVNLLKCVVTMSLTANIIKDLK